jgi:hypothetical protein
MNTPNPITTVTSRAAATPAPDPGPGPTITRYATLADEFLRLIQQAAAVIPKLEESHAVTAPFVRGHQTIPMEFLATVVASVEQSEELRTFGASIFDAAAARDHLQFIEAFRPVLDRLSAFSENLKFTLATRKAEVTFDCLQMYYHTKRLGEHPNMTQVAAFGDNMKRDLGRRGSAPSLAVRRALAKLAAGQSPNAQNPQQNPQKKEGSAPPPAAGHA